VAADFGVRVSQLRVVVEVADFDQAARFFRDAMGLPVVLAHDNPGDDRVMILGAGAASIEIGTAAHSRAVDEIEGSARPSPPIRLACEVADAAAATTTLEGAGAQILGAVAVTPWGSLNARLAGPAHTQLTLFQQLEPGPERGQEPDPESGPGTTPGSTPAPATNPR
jgi:catechol 2,3-dioxygenase-like lactoylglutathione lyase family enzyme